jgi:hypothetical protein
MKIKTAAKQMPLEYCKKLIKFPRCETLILYNSNGMLNKIIEMVKRNSHLATVDLEVQVNLVHIWNPSLSIIPYAQTP